MRKKVIAAKVLAGILAATIVFTDSSMMTLAAGIEQPVASSETEVSDELEESAEENADESEGEEETSADEEVTEEGTEESTEGKTEDETVDETEETSEEVEEVEEVVSEDAVGAALSEKYPEFVWAETIIISLSEGYEDTENIVIPSECTNIMGNFGTKIKTVNFSNASSLETIDNGVFKECVGLTNIDLSGCTSLTTIGANAFYGCSAVESVILPTNLHNIGSNAFAETQITEIILTEGITSIGDKAFANCTKLEKVVDNAKTLKSVGESVFSGCYLKNISFGKDLDDIPSYLFTSARIQTITIPKEFTEIGAYAFYKANVEEIVFEDGIENMVFGSYAFSYSSITEIALPDKTTSIGDHAFYVCSNLAEITIPSTVNVLGTYAFANCSQLKQVTINAGMLEAISDYAFYTDAILEEIVLPENIVKVGKSAFESDKALKSVAFSSKTVSIADRAFLKSGLLSVTVPASVTTIGASVFEQCVKMTSFTIEEGSVLKSIGNFTCASDEALSSVYLPNSWEVTTIPKGSFQSCTSLNSIVIPNSINKLETNAFYGCSKLVKAVIPSVTYISESVFSECSVLLYTTADNKFIFNDNLTSIGATAFQNCKLLKKLVIPTQCSSIGKKAFNGTALNEIEIKSTSLTAAQGAFGGTNVTIKKVTFPENITKIPDYMFWETSFENGCEITIPGTVTTIGKYAFRGSSTSVTNISKINFEDADLITDIGDYAFAYCTKLAELDIPKNVKTIGQYAYQNCQFMEIKIPSTVTSIGKGAFSECNQLAKVDFEGTDLTSIGDYVFSGCTALDRIMIPASVNSIGSYSFEKCTKLVYIYIPSTVTSIGTAPFSGADTENLKIYAMEGTYAYNWAIDNKFAANLCQDGICSITYVLGNDVATNHAKNPKSYVPEYEVVQLFDPVCTDFDFLGWYTDSDFKTKVETTEGMSGNITLYASWFSAKKYDITFSLNGGVARTEDAKALLAKRTNVSEHDEVILPSENELVCEDWMLVGWTTVNQATNPIYEQGGTYKNIASGGKNVTLYARWCQIFIQTDNSKAAKIILEDGTKKDSYNASNNSYFGNIKLPTAEEIEVASGYGLTGEIYCDDNGKTYHLGDEIPAKELLSNGITKKCYLKIGTEKLVPYTVILEGNATDATLVTGAEKTYSANVAKDFVLPEGKDVYTRTGYDFVGWCATTTKTTSSPYVTTIAANTRKANDTIRLYAIWKPAEYEINYNLEPDATNNIKNPATFVFGKRVTLLAPARKGYTFAGWFSNPEFTGTKITFIDGKSAAPVNVYPKWTMNKYSLTYNINGGNARKVVLPTRQINLNQDNVKSEITITNVISIGNEDIRPGYKFEGWSTDKTATVAEFEPGEKTEYLAERNNAAVILYATWKPISYNVTYVLNGSEQSPVDNEINVAKLHTPATVIKLANPTREGYTFAGWYLDAEFTSRKQTTITKTQYSDITLYAKWTPNKYYITLNANGGVQSTDRAVKTATTAALARTQKDFYQNVTFAGVDVSTLYASAMADNIITTDEATAIENANKTDSFYLTKKNCVLVGWNTAKDGSGTHYDLGASINKGTEIGAIKQNANIILYAEWAPVASAFYTIKYEVNGGTINNSSAKKDGTVYTQVKTSSLAAKLAVPVRTGYTFGGWYTDSAFTTRKVVSFVKGTNTDQTVYAKWTENAYRIVYNVNGGKKANAKALAPAVGIKYTSEYELAGTDQIIRDTSKYEFLGWSTVKDAYAVGAHIYKPGEKVWELTDGNNKAVTLYAQWKQIY